MSPDAAIAAVVERTVDLFAVDAEALLGHRRPRDLQHALFALVWTLIRGLGCSQRRTARAMHRSGETVGAMLVSAAQLRSDDVAFREASDELAAFAAALPIDAAIDAPAVDPEIEREELIVEHLAGRGYSAAAIARTTGIPASRVGRILARLGIVAGRHDGRAVAEEAELRMRSAISASGGRFA